MQHAPERDDAALKRVLIISPHFPPLNAADMQRVRMLLPFFRENGWQAEVLTVSPGQVAMAQDAWLLEGIPDDIPVHHVKALGLAWTKIPGFGSLGFRASRALAKAGDRLLAGKKFDLVYFSTTVFPVHKLGPRWKKKYAVPFVMDYQDPWVNDYYRKHPEITPPGGRLKYGIIDRLHRRMEPKVLRHCAGITSVSEAYLKQLASRYPDMRMPPVLVQAFPGARRDFERLVDSSGNTVFDKTDGNLHWLYIGRGGADMATALRGLFAAIRDYATEDLKQRLRLHFIGTSYAAVGSGTKTISPIAAEYGLEDIVMEDPGRMAYSKTLQCLKQADALIVPGSNDPAYTASKIYPYLLAQKPLLAIFHEDSSVVKLIENVGGAVCVAYRSKEEPGDIGKRIAASWLANAAYGQVKPLDQKSFEPFTDASCAEVLCMFFDQCLMNTRH
jgi:hypothetical protein